MSDSVLAPIQPQFRALAETLLPEMRGMDALAWDRAQEIIERMLQERPEKVRRQVGMFVRLANALPVLRYGRTFTALDLERRARFLARLEDAPLLLVRRGVWGLRTLVFMGYYGQATVRSAIGYRAQPAGWSARRRANA